jgi:predicted ATPase/DNA-binding SARP family transcriptional activator
MEFRILGPLEVWADGRPVPVAAGKQRAILAILLLQANQVVSTERLIELLWGDEAPETAANSLQVHVSQLRKALDADRRVARGSQIVITQAPGYLLRADSEDTDIGNFKRHVDDARLARTQADWQSASKHLRDALKIWRGPALADVLGENFAVAERGQLEELRLQALEDRIEADLMLGAHADLIAELQTLVSEHPFRERFRGQLMLALYRSGRQAESSAVYQQTRELLVDELGMEPGADLQRLLKQILNQDPVLDIKAPVLTIRRESRLPHLRDAFVGRGREMEQLAKRLEGSSMVTLTGAGGMGKTRLAVELAAKVSHRYRDGVVFVDLAPLTDQSLVPRTVSWAIGLNDDGVRGPMDVAVEHLKDRSLLMVLDNCEHVLSTAASAATEMLGQCRGLSILATSREPLGVPGEVTWQVAPLSNRRNGSRIMDVDHDDGEAVELFRVRAETADPKFNWDDDAAGYAGRICDRLDGSPLAIELAAARLRVMPPRDLLAGLDTRFALLTTGSRTALPRQRSLEATVDWSYQLLTPKEQLLLQRLAVFAGGFTPAAAEEVCADQALARADVMPALFGLVEKSMIRAGSDLRGGARYTMLETIREYGLNRLRAHSNDGEALRRHADYFSRIAATSEASLRTEQQVEWLAQLEDEHDNFRTAMDWALQKAPAVALEIATNLGDYWRRNRIGEGNAWVTRAMQGMQPTGELAARAVDVAGQLARLVGELDVARKLWAEAAERWAALGEVRRAAFATDRLGALHFETGARAVGLELMNKAVEMLRPTGDEWELASALNNLGYSLHRAGDTPTAKPFVDEALILARKSGDPWSLASVLDSAADIEMSLGRHNEARAFWEECFALVTRLGDKGQAASVLEARAQLALLEGDPEFALRLIAAGQVSRNSIGEATPQDWREVVKTTLEAARSQLPDSAADEAWHEGETMAIEEIMKSVIEG